MEALVLWKKAGAISAPAVQLVCARINFVELNGMCEGAHASKIQALRRGRTVRSRTCARMLDICIPFS